MGYNPRNEKHKEILDETLDAIKDSEKPDVLDHLKDEFEKNCPKAASDHDRELFFTMFTQGYFYGLEIARERRE